MAGRKSDEAFETVFEPHRRAITLHCYRMLGSLQDAEEVVQEALLRAWQRQAELSSPHATRAWLYKIATNACLDMLKRRRRRALPHRLGPNFPRAPNVAARAASAGTPLGPPADAQLWVEPAPDTLLDYADAGGQPDAQASLRQSIGLAFITALQLLTPKQRAALLLVDVLGFRPEEAAPLLQTSVISVSSLLQRARKNVEAHTHDLLPPKPSSTEAALLRRYITSWESRDLEAFTALLADDIVLSMPPQPEWFVGREAVGRFLGDVLTVAPRAYRLVPVRANAGPALAFYTRALTSNAVYEATAIVLLTLRAGRVSEMTRFAFPKLFPLFGLPAQLPSDTRGLQASGS